MSLFSGLDDIFTNVLGEDTPFTIRRDGEADLIIPGIFERRFLSADAGIGEVETKKSAAHVSSKLLPSPLVSAYLEYDGERFRIIGNHPDDQDMTILILQLVGPVE
jgi:hypothetical protein